MIDPPSEIEAADTPKKAWAKPTILRIADGALETRSGVDPMWTSKT